MNKTGARHIQNEWFKKYDKKFRSSSTTSLIKDYPTLNSDYKRIARSEFKKRRVPAKKLPYKKR